ncbi:TonB-dependent receptor [Colwellia sp. E2M01]|uniref:TonB-dependent receptor plug domain-containing protein n=1 Tax=Colwellia sp. E2M01 TaxID=2841561 RepID=UPI001C094C59|nr:TonB-dependent receptor [Colwellia sp. E2M01]MBU2871683.1 TonB-dependent receptor [Colwellia sp. E2M01]
MIYIKPFPKMHLYSNQIIKILAIYAASNLFSTAVIAQEEKSTTHSSHHPAHHSTKKKADEVIVVTGTRTPKLLANSPVQVEVIEQEQINLLTQGTIAQALNFIPGVVVTRNQKDGYNVQMQGFDGDNVLILLDSQPLISPTGAAVDLDQISAQDIKQIEVIRGAASVMYGSSAMGGVINIITNQGKENQLNLSYEVGSYTQNSLEDDLYSHQARLGATLLTGDWRHQVNTLLKHTPGFDYDNDHSSTPAGSLDKIFINLASSGKIGSLDTAIKYQFFDEEKDKNTGRIAGQSNYQHYISEVQQQQFDFDISQKLNRYHDKIQRQWQVNSRIMEHQETSGGTGSLRNANFGLYEVNGKYVWSTTELEIVSGGLIHKDTLEQTKVDDGSKEVPFVSKESIEAFSQVNWINKNSQYLLGLRVQDDSSFGFNSALRVSGMNNLLTGENKLKLRYGVGQGYRVPTLKERFYEFDHSSLGYKVYGNEDLNPETSITANTSLTFETSFEESLLGSFDFTSDVNIFYTQAKDLIDSVTDPERSIEEALDISVYTNIDEAILKGFDWSVAANYSQWQSQLNYSYVSAKDNNHVRLEGRPKHQFKASIGYTPSKYNINSMLYLVYQKDEAVPTEGFENGTLNNSWFTIDFKLSHQFSKHFSWRLTLENILDEHQDTDAVREQLFDARPVSSRFVSLGITYKL